jgi:hypothetical protein
VLVIRTLLALLPLLTAGVRAVPPAPPKIWLGTVEPWRPIGVSACTDCKRASIMPGPGSVIVLSPSDGSPAATGDVVVVSPLVGVIWRGRIEGGRISVPWFNFDLREGDAGVLVLPATQDPRFVEPTPADVIAIKQAMLRNEVLSFVKRSVDGTEVGAIDLDGNGKADLAVTYGCNMWGDGRCQGRGQFFLARRGTKWVEID